ncbi:uncharacterized protein ColKHC_11098 [Colletotrichum higginsianum]|nr:uncharacterized protein ColKHC_11098 [Colletotrichum higginsianum]
MLSLDGELHRAQVDGDVRGVGDELAGGEKMAQEKSRRSLMEVEMEVRWRVVPICSAMAMKRWAKTESWMGSTGEEEEGDAIFEEEGSGVGVVRVVEGDDGRLDVFSRRTDDNILGNIVEAVDARVVPRAVDIDALPLLRLRGWTLRAGRQLLQRRRLADPRASASRAADLDRLDDDVPVHREGELAQVRRLEPGRVVPVLRPRDGQVRVGAEVPQHEALVKDDRVLSSALRVQLRTNPRPQRREAVRDVGRGAGVELPPLGLGDAVRRQQRRELVDQDAADAQLVGDVAGVLAAGAAEGDEVVVLGREAAGLGGVADGAGHGLVGDVEEAEGDVVRRQGPRRLGVEVRREAGELARDDGGVEGLVGVRTEDGREGRRDEAAEEEVRVCHGQGPAFPVTGRARMRAGALRANGEEAVAGEKDGAAAGSYGGDVEHGHGDGAAGDGGLGEVVVAAVVAGDVGAGAAHVESDDGRAVLGVVAGPRDADDAARGPAEQGLVAAEAGGRLEAAVGAHEVDAARRDAEAGAEAVDVAPDDGVQASVQVEVLRWRNLMVGEVAAEVVTKAKPNSGSARWRRRGPRGPGGARVPEGPELGPNGVRVRAAEDADEFAAGRADEVCRVGGV